MNTRWIPVALLSSTLLIGCNNRNPQNSQNFDQNAGGTVDTVPVTEGTQPTTGVTDARTNGQSHHANVDRPSAPPDLPVGANRAATAPRATSARTEATRTEATRFQEVTVPAGTSLPLELMTALSSDTANVETPVRARLRSPVRVNGYAAIPAGTVFSGSVTDVEESGRVKGRARLTFRFDEATVNGVRERVTTNPITFQAEATKGEDATKIGAGAGIGAAIGGILGGGKGAAKGAVIGGAAGTGAVLATKGKDVTLAAGTDLTTDLTDAVTVRAR
jgi:hypothetical protein